MYPHPNKLPRWLKALLIGSGIALLLTGLLWEALHWREGLTTPELALPHPWEAPLMRLHGLAMFVFLFSLGGLGPVHVPRGWRERRNLKTGLSLITLAVVLSLSGYALYYWTDDHQRSWVGSLHALFGLGMVAALLLHWRGRRAGGIP